MKKDFYSNINNYILDLRGKNNKNNKLWNYLNSIINKNNVIPSVYVITDTIQGFSQIYKRGNSFLILLTQSIINTGIDYIYIEIFLNNEKIIIAPKKVNFN